MTFAQTLGAARRKLAGLAEQATSAIAEIDDALRQLGLPAEPTPMPAAAPKPAAQRRGRPIAAAPTPAERRAPAELTANDRSLLNTIGAHPACSQAEILALPAWSGTRPNILGRALKRLAGAGQISVAGTGKSARYTAVGLAAAEAAD